MLISCPITTQLICAFVFAYDDHFQEKNCDFFLFCLKHRLWVHIRTVLGGSNKYLKSICFRAKIKRIMNTVNGGKPQLYLIKVFCGFKGSKLHGFVSKMILASS